MRGALLLTACLGTLALLAATDAAPPPADAAAAAVVRGRELQFPRDFGAHNEFRTEWWYITGWLRTPDGKPLGFQITFFRSRTSPELLAGNPSSFSPAQILVGHSALSDPRYGRLRQSQRIARAGFGLASASQADTQVSIDRWHLQRTSDGYTADVAGDDFALALTLVPAQAPMVNGDRGFSQKSPLPQSASYYYSIPHLTVTGNATRDGVASNVTGEAWLDHEWSSEFLDPDAAGWDWTGINFDDGSALMAFRIRAKDGSTRWAGATLRAANGAVHTFEPTDIAFTPVRRWRSERTGVTYPTGWQVRVGALDFEIQPLMQDQENDTRATTGAIYWEGAITAARNGRSIGRGYLELTGYGTALRLR